MIYVAVICVALIALNVVQYVSAQKERERLVRRVAEPQQVIVENAPKRDRPERVWTDAQYLKLNEERGTVTPGDN